MRILWDWTKSWFGIGQVSRHLCVLDRNISRLRQERKIAEVSIEEHTKEIEEIQTRFEELMVKTKTSLDRAVQVNKKLQAALDSTQEEVKTAHEITIPGLVAANKVLIQRWEAESQILAVRSALATQALSKGSDID